MLDFRAEDPRLKFYLSTLPPLRRYLRGYASVIHVLSKRALRLTRGVDYDTAKNLHL